MKRFIIGLISILILSQIYCHGQKSPKFPLKVGAARVDITSKNEPTFPATGKYDHERSYVRAIVLDNNTTRAAIITMDIAGFNSDSSMVELLTQLTSDLACPKENILITPTHTHSAGAPSFPTKLPPQQSISQYSDKIIYAVRQAISKLQPANIGFGRGASYLNVNRDAIERDTRKWTQASNPDGFSDKSVDVIKFEDLKGEPIAVYFSYAMHPVNGYVVGVFSADFPGAACRYVEKAFGDKIIVAFSQGASGDQNPLYLRPSTNAMASRSGVEITGYEMKREPIEAPVRTNPNPPLVGTKELDNLFRMMESEGQLLGEEVIRIMTLTSKTTDNVPIRGIQKTFSCPGRTRINFDFSNPVYREGIAGEYRDGPEIEHHLGILGLGTNVIAYSDGEIFSFIGQRVKKESPLTNTMFVELAYGRGPGYVPNDAAFGEQTFQVLTARDKEGCAEQTIVNGLYEMITKYLISR
jgi:neutral ceramidase